MAVNGGIQVVGAVLSANVVDTAILKGSGFSVKITNLNQVADLYWTVDSIGGALIPPTVGGVNCFCAASVGPGGDINTRAGDFMYGAVVQLVANGPVHYLVELQSAKATS